MKIAILDDYQDAIEDIAAYQARSPIRLME
jgi:hypothetical protein